MRLTELNPSFIGAGGAGITNSETGEPVPERKGVALAFDCPCGTCGKEVILMLKNPMDGKPYETPHPQWTRTGETFETITLRPSILRMDGCKWHGYLTDGELKSV